ncbi:hypothetical protein DERP_006351 [Dermatophagoides pteronyssinus]|uniref:Uncharacterized protein n=1 Tax=Dermatophagoides pteronyssinus TaxID=6956 RepID=A0ABQ8IYI4_DERPT|nr:hypothetical protein DERP_006351 [Dermatophagoides pteronyssinus]
MASGAHSRYTRQSFHCLLVIPISNDLNMQIKFKLNFVITFNLQIVNHMLHKKVLQQQQL